jgi:guanylate kinase
MDVSRLVRQGILFILSAPSGAGKTSISNRVLGEIQGLELSISYTTRGPRPGEVPGHDYHFVSGAEFERMREAGEFAEWARVHDALYGTPRAPIERALGEGRDMLLDIDVQGAAQIRVGYPEAVAVFVLPPSEEELERRLRARRTDSEDVIRRRLARAKAEMEEFRKYDYYVVNRDLGESVRSFAAVVSAERARVSRLRD